MWRFLVASLASLLLFVVTLRGQAPPPPTPAPPTGEVVDANKDVVLPWTVGVVFTLIIMVIVCMPTRKAQ